MRLHCTLVLSLSLAAPALAQPVAPPRISNTVIDLDRNAGGVRASLGKSWSRPTGNVRLDFGVESEVQSDDRQNFANDSWWYAWAR